MRLIFSILFVAISTSSSFASNCDSLKTALQAKYNKKPNDATTQLEVINTFNENNCVESEFYGKVCIAYHTSKPSHESAFWLGEFNYGIKHFSESLKYYREALRLAVLNKAVTQETKTSYNRQAAMAAINSNDFVSAYDFSDKVIQQNPEDKFMYLIQSKSVAGAECGKNDFELKLRYFLAYDLAEKAQGKNAQYDNASRKLMEYCKEKFPSTKELFDNGMIDKTKVRIGCHFNKAARIRTSSF